MVWYNPGTWTLRPWVKETGPAWASFLKGDGLIYVSPARIEPVRGQMYDVGDVIKLYNQVWVASEPNQVTPVEMLGLLNWLDRFTASLEAVCGDRSGTIGGVPAQRLGDSPGDPMFAPGTPGFNRVCEDLRRWRVRLDEYIMFNASVPAEFEHDRETIAYHVTAPLFLGWFGGKDGLNVTLEERPWLANGFSSGFDASVPHMADIGTPYTIANQLGIAKEWKKERRHALVSTMTLNMVDDRYDYWDGGGGGGGDKDNSFRNIAIAAGAGALAFAILRK